MRRQRIVFTVTNDLVFDQRMQRICSSLQSAGYHVLMIGRRMRNSPPLSVQSFEQKRLFLAFSKGFLFYAEYNLRLFLMLLFVKCDALCAIDLDTVLPVLWASKLRRRKRFFDAHELFCEMKEVVTRPSRYRFWKSLERYALPQFPNGYTVNEPIKQEFKNMYGLDYAVVRNISVLRAQPPMTKENFLIYQGAVNEGRSFETLIPAFKFIDYPLHIYGDGNFLASAKKLVQLLKLQDKIIFKGKAVPDHLRTVTPKALLGFTLFENKGLSNYYSLGNRFFDYVHAAIPQICVAYPVYEELNAQYEVALLVTDLSAENLAQVINQTLSDETLLTRITQNCLQARAVWNWQEEEKRLLQFYYYHLPLATDNK